MHECQLRSLLPPITVAQISTSSVVIDIILKQYQKKKKKKKMVDGNTMDLPPSPVPPKRKSEQSERLLSSADWSLVMK